MNGDSPHGGRPWSVDLLADLHADGADRSGLDADAHEVLAALDATQAELATLPPIRMPDDVAARIDAALAAEAARGATTGPPQAATGSPWPRGAGGSYTGPVQPQTPSGPFSSQSAAGTGPQPVAMPSAPVPLRPAVPPVNAPIHARSSTVPVADLAEARSRRNRRLGVAGGLLAAAAIVVGVVFVVLPSGGTSGVPQAVPQPTTASSSVQTDPQNTGPLTLANSELPAAGVKAIGFHDYGPFTDAAKLSACLTANGLDAGVKPLFGRQATIDGRPAEMFLLSTGKAVRYQLLVVGADCAAGRPATIANSTIGH